MSFPKNMGKNIGKNISKSLSVKHGQKPFDHNKQSAADALKTVSKRVIQKKAEGTGDMIGNKIANRITKVSKTSPRNSLEIVKNERDKEIPTERYISPEEGQKIIDALRLIE